MNIIELAKEAGCHASVITGAVCFNPGVLERFAALVRAEAYQQGRDDMKEEAAKVCDDMAELLHKHFKGAQAEEATTCAAAIRGLK